jgi:hypothetical protein
MPPYDFLDEKGRVPLDTQALIKQQLDGERVARVSQAAIDALPAGREKRMVIALDELLSFNLGSAEGYLGSIGLPTTRKLQRALAEYGITPDYGQAYGYGRRTISRT